MVFYSHEKSDMVYVATDHCAFFESKDVVNPTMKSFKRKLSVVFYRGTVCYAMQGGFKF